MAHLRFRGRIAALVSAAILVPLCAKATEYGTFSAPDGSFVFDYPAGFSPSQKTGVSASSPASGDVSIDFYSHAAATITEVSEQTRQAVIDNCTNGVAVLPSIKFKSATMTTMLGQAVVDTVFENTRFGAPLINRFVATFRDGKEYNFTCFYSADKAEQFASDEIPRSRIAKTSTRSTGAMRTSSLQSVQRPTTALAPAAERDRAASIAATLGG